MFYKLKIKIKKKIENINEFRILKNKNIIFICKNIYIYNIFN